MIETNYTKENIPDYYSDRVTATVNYDESDRRHLTHVKHICIDNKIVYSESFTEDDDFASCSEEEPNSKKMWNTWISTLK